MRISSRVHALAVAITMLVVVFGTKEAAGQRVQEFSNTTILNPPSPEEAEAVKRAHDLAQLASELLEKGKVDKAILFLKEADALLPDNFHALLAEAYRRKGNDAEAMRYYRLCVYPQDGEIPALKTRAVPHGDTIQLLRFALLLHRSGQREEAINCYRVGLQRMWPDGKPYDVPLNETFETTEYVGPRFEAAAQTGIGIYYFIHSRKEDAMVELKEAIRIRPHMALAHYYIGSWYRMRDDRFAEAKAAFEAAMQYGTPEIRAAIPKAIGNGGGFNGYLLRVGSPLAKDTPPYVPGPSKYQPPPQN